MRRTTICLWLFAASGCDDDSGTDADGGAADAAQMPDAVTPDAAPMPDAATLDSAMPDGQVADPCDTAEEGGACAEEGSFCGGPCDPCSFCNILRCDGGRWGRLEAPPDPNCRPDAAPPEPDAAPPGPDAGPPPAALCDHDRVAGDERWYFVARARDTAVEMFRSPLDDGTFALTHMALRDGDTTVCSSEAADLLYENTFEHRSDAARLVDDPTSFVLFMDLNAATGEWSDFISGVDHPRNLRLWGPEPLDLVFTDGDR